VVSSIQVFRAKLCVHFSCLTCVLHAPSIFLLYLIILIIFVEEYRLRSSSLYSFLQSPATSSLSGPNIHHNTLFSNILNLRSFVSFSDSVPRRYNATGEIVIFFSVFTFSGPFATESCENGLLAVPCLSVCPQLIIGSR
jgi:hypothetical protein